MFGRALQSLVRAGTYLAVRTPISVQGRLASVGAYISVVAGSRMSVRHSDVKVVDFPMAKIVVLSATADNFMYLIVDTDKKEAFVVDPVDPKYVMEHVMKENVTLKGALITHHHWDHAGGNEELVDIMKKKGGGEFLVYGGDDRIPELNKKVKQGDAFKLGSLEFECLFTPCHTSGHICYYLKPSAATEQTPAVFTGDTLFIAGCGRFFEGTPDQMHVALIDKLGKLPNNTLVFCGHEYTAKNLKFAQEVEPENEEVQEKLEWAEKLRLGSIPTVPSTMEEEKKTNPFMRCGELEMQDRHKILNPVELLGKIRQMKDNWKG